MENSAVREDIVDWLGTGSINIFGRPFAGKDTQGSRLAELLDTAVLGGGDILRGSIIPDEIQAYMHSGRLIPSQAYVDIVLPYLSQDQFVGKPLILSSVGRWSGEEEGVIKATKNADHPLRAVIFLNLSEAIVLNRWRALELHNDRGRRYDDTEQTLKTRLQEFSEKTLPVIEAYRQKGILIEIDGNEAPDRVTSRIISALHGRAIV
jgi:adenylate kinase